MELNDLLKKDVMEAVTKNLTSIQVQAIQQILSENDKLKIENEEQKKWIANSEKEIREYRKSLEDTEKELDILQTKFDEQTKYIEHFQEIENKYEKYCLEQKLSAMQHVENNMMEICSMVFRSDVYKTNISGFRDCYDQRSGMVRSLHYDLTETQVKENDNHVHQVTGTNHTGLNELTR